MRVFLELFSGCGRLARAVSRLGYQVLEWDILLGPDYDLMKAANRSRVRGWMLSGAICGIHLGTPCKSWSRARDRPGGPPPLRSNVDVWGLSGLRPADQIKVHVGNVLAKFSCSVLFAARHMQVPAGIENPACSRLWLVPPVKRLLACAQVSEVVTDFCQWGADWLKPTRMVGVCLDLERVARRCRFRTQGFLCSRTGCRHLQLVGTTEQGKFWTLAATYQDAMCQRTAASFENFLKRPAAMVSRILDAKS